MGLPSLINLFKSAANGTVFSPTRYNDDQTAVETAVNQLINGFDNSIASSGYTELPNGLMIQWGMAQLPSTANTVVTTQVNFPTAFTTACYMAIPAPHTTAPDVVVASANTLTTTSFKISYKRPDTTTSPVMWIAIGK